MKTRRFLLFLIIVLGVLFRIWASQPTWIHFDENYYFNIYQNFIDRGELTPYMWRLEGFTNIIAGGGTGYGILVMIWWLNIFGDTLFSVRMLMALASLATAGIYYLISKKWWGTHKAGIAAMIFGIASTSPLSTFVGRMDALGILVYSLLLLLHITAVQQKKKWMHLIVGAFAILTVEFHVLGLLYVGALAFYYGIQYLQELIHRKRFVIFLPAVNYFVGAGLFGSFYIIVHILPNPEAYFIIPSTCDICLKNILLSVSLLFLKILGQRPFELIFIVIFIYTGVKKFEKNQHHLILYLGYFLTHLIIKPPIWIQYYFPILPLIAIGLGGFSAQMLENIDRNKQMFRENVFLMVSISLIVINFWNFKRGHYPFENAYPLYETEEIRYIKEHVPKSIAILSSAANFYQLKEYRNFIDAREQVRYGLDLRDEDYYDFLIRENPKIIYVDDEIFSDYLSLQRYIKNKTMIQKTLFLWVAPEYYISD